LWGILASDRAKLELTVPRERRRPGLTLHRAQLPTHERDIHDGVPVTTPARTLLDLAALLDEHQLARAAERAEAPRLASPTSLADLVRRYPRRAGTPNLRRLVEERDAPALGEEPAIACAVSLERLARAVGVEPVDLDDEALGRPSEVGGDGVMALVDERPRVTQRQLDDEPSRLAGELRALLRSATTAAPGPRPGPRTPAPRSRPAGR
jgi:hypothetical protein